jgi:hypothetical protein
MNGDQNNNNYAKKTTFNIIIAQVSNCASKKSPPYTITIIIIYIKFDKKYNFIHYFKSLKTLKINIKSFLSPNDTAQTVKAKMKNSIIKTKNCARAVIIIYRFQSPVISNNV